MTDMPSACVRYALIGAGIGAETHRVEIPPLSSARLEALNARDAHKAEAFRARCGTRKTYADRGALLSEPIARSEVSGVPIAMNRGLSD